MTWGTIGFAKGQETLTNTIFPTPVLTTTTPANTIPTTTMPTITQTLIEIFFRHEFCCTESAIYERTFRQASHRTLLQMSVPQTHSTSIRGRTRASILSPIGPRPPPLHQPPLRQRRKQQVRQPPNLNRRPKPLRMKSPCVTTVFSHHWRRLQHRLFPHRLKLRRSLHSHHLRRRRLRRRPLQQRLGIISPIDVTVQQQLTRSAGGQQHVLDQMYRRLQR